MNKMILFLFLLLAVIILVACGGSASETAVAPADAPAEILFEALSPQIDVQTAQELSQRDDVFMLDVREQYEYDEKHIPDINLIPMGDIQARINEIPTDKTVVVTCRSGNRSGQITDLLRQNGFDNVHNMSGGIIAWEAAGFPVEQ